jgi:hypothetical protein
MNILLVFASFLSGLLFAIGFAVSGMTQPAKVVGFLDLTGSVTGRTAFHSPQDY